LQVPQVGLSPEQFREAHSLLALQGAPSAPVPPGRHAEASPIMMSVQLIWRMDAVQASMLSTVRNVRGLK